MRRAVVSWASTATFDGRSGTIAVGSGSGSGRTGSGRTGSGRTGEENDTQLFVRLV